MLFFIAGCFVPAFLVSLVATFMISRCAQSWGLLDHPAARKVHTTPTPLGGGIGIWLGVVLPLAGVQLTTWVLTRSPEVPSWFPAEVAQHLDGVLYRSGQMWGIVAAGTILALMGLLDDVRNIPWLPRLVVQVLVAAALVIEGGVQATVFVPLPWVGALLTAVWIIVLVNAFNFLDNMDGLSGGIALIASLMFAAVMLTSTSEPHWLVGGVLLTLSGALCGFLCLNWPPARIFMGDSGSYFVGLMLACSTVLGTFYDFEANGSGDKKHVILAPLFILAVPLYDFLTVIWIRLRQRRSPFHPDKSHFSHRLVEMGFTPRDAVLTIHLATLTTGLGALILFRVSDWTASLLIFALICCVLAIVAILETVGRQGNEK